MGAHRINSLSGLGACALLPAQADPEAIRRTIGFGDPAGDNVQMPASDRASFPNLVRTLSSAIGTADHSPQVVAVTVNGRQVFVMVWVRIINSRNQVVYRVFSRL